MNPGLKNAWNSYYRPFSGVRAVYLDYTLHQNVDALVTLAIEYRFALFSQLWVCIQKSSPMTHGAGMVRQNDSRFLPFENK